MITEIFYWVLNMSIIGSGVGLIVLVLRQIKKLPRFAVYLLWVMPLIRLWIPFGLANPYSLMSLISQYTTKTVVVWEGSPEITMTNTIMAVNSYFPMDYKTNLIENVLSAASAVWVVIATAAILTSVALYFFTKSELRLAERVRDNIYTSSSITTPAVYGIFRPKIIIPAEMVNRDNHYMILHEQVHIKRKDNLFRVIAVMTICVHWFNPLSWVLLKCFFADMELACDTKVLKNLDEKQTKDYAEAILTCAIGKTLFASAFGGARTRVRLENIVSYRKLTLLSSLCFAALVVAIVVVLITNAVA